MSHFNHDHLLTCLWLGLSGGVASACAAHSITLTSEHLSIVRAQQGLQAAEMQKDMITKFLINVGSDNARAHRCARAAEVGGLHTAGARRASCSQQRSILRSIQLQGRHSASACPQRSGAGFGPVSGGLYPLQLLEGARVQRIVQDAAVGSCGPRLLQQEHMPSTGASPARVPRSRRRVPGGRKRASTAIQGPAPSAPLSAIHALSQEIGCLLSSSFLTSCKRPVDNCSELNFCPSGALMHLLSTSLSKVSARTLRNSSRDSGTVPDPLRAYQVKAMPTWSGPIRHRVMLNGRLPRA